MWEILDEKPVRRTANRHPLIEEFRNYNRQGKDVTILMSGSRRISKTFLAADIAELWDPAFIPSLKNYPIERDQAGLFVKGPHISVEIGDFARAIDLEQIGPRQLWIQDEPLGLGALDFWTKNARDFKNLVTVYGARLINVLVITPDTEDIYKKYWNLCTHYIHVYDRGRAECWRLKFDFPKTSKMGRSRSDKPVKVRDMQNKWPIIGYKPPSQEFQKFYLGPDLEARVGFKADIISKVLKEIIHAKGPEAPKGPSEKEKWRLALEQIRREQLENS